MANDTPDRLTGQLMHLPNIIGNLGLNIAAAQTRLDENYLNNLGRLMGMIKATVGSTKTVVSVLAIADARDALEKAQQKETEAGDALGSLPETANEADRKTAEGKVEEAEKARAAKMQEPK